MPPGAGLQCPAGSSVLSLHNDWVLQVRSKPGRSCWSQHAEGTRCGQRWHQKSKAGMGSCSLPQAWLLPTMGGLDSDSWGSGSPVLARPPPLPASLVGLGQPKRLAVCRTPSELPANGLGPPRAAPCRLDKAGIVPCSPLCPTHCPGLAAGLPPSSPCCWPGWQELASQAC